jgi:NAD(P)H dehydrogenase (quinone)
VRIVISGASGQLGRLVAVQLLARLSHDSVILVTRSPNALADLANRGVEVRHGDFDQPASLPHAFQGGDRLLLISTPDIGRRVEQHRAAVDAAALAGVQHVVYTSVTNPVAGHPSGLNVDEHRETEEMLQECGLAWTVLRNAAYAEVQVPLGVVSVTYGKLVTNAGDGRFAPISRSDCATAAVAVLTGKGHEGKTYEITGAEALTKADIAKLVTHVTGHPVRIVPVGDWRLLWGLTRLGTPRPAARAIVNLGIATREGYFDIVDTAFEELTGRPPRTLREVLVAHRAELVASDEPAMAYGG